MTLTGSKATVALWAPLSDSILTGHESGKIGKYDVKTGEEVNNVDAGEGHRGEITDIQLSPDGTYFITSSKDKTARVSFCFQSSCLPIVIGKKDERERERSDLNPRSVN